MKTTDTLDLARVAYKLYAHEETFDAQHLAAALRVPGHNVATTVLSRTEWGIAHVVAELPATRRQLSLGKQVGVAIVAISQSDSLGRCGNCVLDSSRCNAYTRRTYTSRHRAGRADELGHSVPFGAHDVRYHGVTQMGVERAASGTRVAVSREPHPSRSARRTSHKSNSTRDVGDTAERMLKRLAYSVSAVKPAGSYFTGPALTLEGIGGCPRRAA